MTDTIVSNLVINKLTKALYDSIENPSDTELYLVPDEIDDTPTSGSDNPVTSDGIYEALSSKVAKPTSSTDNAIVRFDGTNGLVLNSGVTINDSNHVTATKFITSGGTSSQFVKGDGTLDSTAYGTYSKPSGGIPKTDLASAVLTSLGKADSALLSHQDISGKEDKSNKVTSISSSSTDTQYPSAKLVYSTTSVLAPKASPALTGTPTAPTAAAGTNTTQIATTAFVKNAVDSKTHYIANLLSGDAANYITEPEFKSVKVNGSSTNSASSSNCVLQYDTTNKCLKFIFN